MFRDEQVVGEVSEKIQKALLDITHNMGSVVLVETLNIHVHINNAIGAGAKVSVTAPPATIFWPEEGA